MPSKECTLKTPKVGVGVINDLRNNEELIDVTLRCEGGRIGAHKILLAANSPYFRAVFQENPAQHPVIIFKNVQYSDLMAIVEFIYQGETTINSDQLQSVLSTAKMLSISGLTDDWNNSGHKRQQTDAHESVTQQLLQPPGQKTTTTAPNSQSSNMAPNSTTVHELLQTQIPTTSKTPKVRKMLHVKFAPDIQQQVHQPQEPVEQLQHKKQEEHEQVNARQKEIISDQAGSSTNNKSFVRDHVEKIGTTHADKVSNQSALGPKCSDCLRFFSSSCTLRRHQMTKHKYVEDSIVCTLCMTKFKNKWSFSTHKSKFHPVPRSDGTASRDEDPAVAAATGHETQKRTY